MLWFSRLLQLTLTSNFLSKCHSLPALYYLLIYDMNTGLSFKNYQLQARMSAARSLLKSTDYSMGRIAELLGYQDVYLYSSQFKKKTGMSPTEFRGKVELETGK